MNPVICASQRPFSRASPVLNASGYFLCHAGLAEMFRKHLGETKMTRTTVTAIVLTLLTAGTVTAANAADTNGDGVLTIDEVQAVMPDISADAFNVMDLNADGALDADEVQAAQDAGLMPA